VRVWETPVVTLASWAEALLLSLVQTFALLVLVTGKMRVSFIWPVCSGLLMVGGWAPVVTLASWAPVVTLASWAEALLLSPVRTFALLLRLTGKMRVSFFCPVCSGTTGVWV
jgi:hypothetical protein